MAAREATVPGPGGGGEGRPRGQRQHHGGERGEGAAAMWDAVGQRCSGRCRGDLQPARRPLRPPRERGSPLGEAAHGGVGVVPPVVASGSARRAGRPRSCFFARRFPRRGPGAVGHRSPQACRLEVAPAPHPSLCPSCSASRQRRVGGRLMLGGRNPPYPCGLVPHNGRRGRHCPLGRGMPTEDR